LRPLLKWAGGKRSLVERIVGLFPEDITGRSFHEPFFGGGAVFFHVEPGSGSINDINPKLMNFYRVVRDDPAALIEEASKYRYEEEEFYEHRSKFNSPGLSDVEYAAILLYLNKTAYNGLYRVNSKGEFNVPGYDYVLEVAEEDSLCYLDPPYHPASETANFTDYSMNGFKVADQERLRDLCLELDRRGVVFVLSNSYTEKVTELYGDHGFRIESLKTRRSISSKVSSRDSGYDMLISNNA
jgi:DNA adenine methylase